MTEIPQRINFNGFVYRLVARHGTAAMFQQVKNVRVLAFEIWMVGSLFRVPKDEEFGNTAWTYKMESEAQAKLDSLDISKPANQAENANKKE